MDDTTEQPVAKRGRGRPPHVPTDDTRNIVMLGVGWGMSQDSIADRIGIDRDTLSKHYQPELTSGLDYTNGKVAGKLYKMAMEQDNVTAAIFWLKARAGWRDRPALDVEDGNTVVVIHRLASAEPPTIDGIKTIAVESD